MNVSSMPLLDRRDWWLIAPVAVLCGVGSLLVWSATDGGGSGFFVRQLVNIAIGAGLATAVALVHHRWVRLVAPGVYGAAVLGLVLVLVAGSTINGSRSWLVVGGMSIQPAEIAKFAVIVGMALVLAERHHVQRRTGVGVVDVISMLAVAAVPAALILAQPDLGTMLVLTATVFGVLAAAGTPRRWLALLGVGGVTAAAFAVASGMLKDYQVDRFLAFTDPTLDPRGAGYNTEQARIAVGNGGWLGQGLFDGSQTNSGFVPEQHTDFVFTVAGEELGLVGAGAIIGLIALVVWRALAIAAASEDLFGRVAAAGIGCWFGFQAFQNIGMCLGIMPVTGVPLPFVSYGGSSMFACLMAVGLLLNIAHRTREAPESRARPARITRRRVVAAR